MITKSIKNIDSFKISHTDGDGISYGFNQEWYKTKWQRSAGCGPTAAANLIYYLQCSAAEDENGNCTHSQSQSLKRMETLWDYVTPKLQGINTTKALYKGVLKYAEAAGMKLEYAFIDIPRKKSARPPFRQLLVFIGTALDEDAPVAFLNLHNGEEKSIYSWHWVTIVKMEYEQDGSAAYATILDEGQVKKVDLLRWFSSTRLGGGFVRFGIIDNHH